MIFCADGIIPDSGLTGPNNIYIYIYIYTHTLHITKQIYQAVQKCYFFPNVRVFNTKPNPTLICKDGLHPQSK